MEGVECGRVGYGRGMVGVGCGMADSEYDFVWVRHGIVW